ncbi:solute carrier family 35, member F1/2 [Paragonimus westermani]|uniref:Solute carrier family 35, member F1/2 n=1 Tax=Paragonimus westermani TaxID=34504 RepID=A0A5J4NLX5_9TREM|nr:solute carrier family 35, member F1/2 [Paragonimus westermani]
MKDDKQPLELENEESTICGEKGNAHSNEPEPRCSQFKRICWVLFIGQTLAILSALSGICAGLLVTVGVNLPLAQNIPHYATLTITFTAIHMIRRCIASRSSVTFKNPEDKVTGKQCDRNTVLKIATYLAAGITDIHGIWATVIAYRFTNVASIQLLNCLSIPTSMFTSYLLLYYRYSWTHYLGAFICVLGAGMMVGADVLASNNNRIDNFSESSAFSSQQQVVIGDLLAITGAVLYGISSSFQEYITCKFGITSYLSWCTLISAVCCATYSAALEHTQLTEIMLFGTINGNSIPTLAILYCVGYAISMFCQDALMAYTITHISAVLINLSLLSTSVYGLVAGILLFHLRFHFLYFIAFGVIFTGLVLFAVRTARRAHLTNDSGG